MGYRMRLVKSALLSLGLLALLSLGGVAQAKEDVQLFGVLEAKDVVGSKLTISGVVYDVTARTRMWDSKGQAVTLEDLVPFDIHQGLFAAEDATAVQIEATEVRGRWLLLSLRVVEALPE